MSDKRAILLARLAKAREAKIKKASGVEELEGGALSAKELKGLLGASYDPKIDKVGDFILDSKLSTKTSKVYHNPNTAQVVVAHKGTEGILDWGNNAVYALGGKTAYKMTSRYKEAEKVQKKAESKYGAKNVSTIGHSQGGLQAELLGGKSKEIITLNKATRPFESNTNKNQYDVRSGRDVVSALNPFEKKSSKNIEIEGESYNPLAEHSGDVLDRLEENQMIGEGIRRMMEGGATPQQRNIAGILRSRVSEKVAPFLDSSLPYDPRDNNKSAWFGLIKLLHSLVHSVDTPAEIRNSINTKAYDIKDFVPAYTDYEDRENYIDEKVATQTKYGLSNKTLPDKVLQMAIDAYISSLMLDPTTRNRNFNKVGDILEPKPSDEIPKSLIDSKYISNDKLRRYNRLVGNLDVLNTAYWTDKAEKATGRRLDPIAVRLIQLQQSWTNNQQANFNRLRGEITAQITAVNADINDWVRKVRRIEDVELRDKLLKDMKNESVFVMNDGNDDDYEIDQTLPSWNDNPAYISVFRDAKTNVYPQRPAPVVAVAPAVVAPAVAVGGAKGKAPARGKVGKGLPTNKIDFEDINWGSLTEQMKAYNSSHSKDLDLEGFARMIIADPKSFQKRTLQRARFYINVLLPKKK